MSILAGSYERFIWGYKLKSPKDSNSETLSLTLAPLFSFPSHLSPIKCAAVAGTRAASGGADDTIKIYDLSASVEIGSFHQDSSITSLAFYTLPNLSSYPRNLFAATDDGSVSIYDAYPLVHLKTLKVHRKGVNSLAVHPSGRLGLTVGRDECLAIVNLVRGRRSFYCRLGKEASIVKFSLTGDNFYMVVDDKISVHEAEDAKMIFELDSKKRVLCATPGANEMLFTGGEDKSITTWDTRTGNVAHTIDGAHPARVKGIVVLSKSDDAPSEGDPYIVASGSSDGIIRVWDMRMAKKDKPNPLAEANTKSRLTCLAGSSVKCLGRPQTGKSNLEQESELMLEES